MKGLYLRLALTLLGATLVGAAASLAVLTALQGEANRTHVARIAGAGIGVLRHQLETSPASRWSAILEQARPHVDFALNIAAESDVAAAERNHSVRGPPAKVYLAIADTGQMLVLGPLERPSLGLLLWPLAVFTTTLVLVATAMLSFPLAARLSRMQRALRMLGEGRWDVRLDSDSEGALRSLAESVNRSAEKLAALFAEREGLLQAVSHEIGTPLARMRFQVELLEPHVSEAQSFRLGALRRDLAELDELSSELVRWVEADTGHIKTSNFAFSPVVEPLLELACQDAEHLQTRLELPPDLVVHAEPRQFQRAIENLLRNAGVYARSRVVVSAESKGSTVEVCVRDDGPGIPPGQRERLLEPFTRLERSRSREHGGLGLGLAIVQRIALAHGGKVRIEDAPEGGACVRTIWPAAPTQ